MVVLWNLNTFLGEVKKKIEREIRVLPNTLVTSSPFGNPLPLSMRGSFFILFF
jgi:hypothetical protein